MEAPRAAHGLPGATARSSYRRSSMRTPWHDVGSAIDAEMYRFFDRHGRTLALRPDLTIPTARVVGTRLYDQPLPLRIAYTGSVFRYEPPRAGRQHEFTQVGVELIGAAGQAADAEVVALAVAALRAAGLPEFKVTLGHVGFFRGLLAAQPPAPCGGACGVDRRPRPSLAGCWRRPLNPRRPRRSAGPAHLTAMPPCSAEAEATCLNTTMMTALAELQGWPAARRLRRGGCGRCDPAGVRNLDYYTASPRGLCTGLELAVISGGRYDDLIGHFGPPLPSAGRSRWIALLAAEPQGRQRRTCTMLLAADGCPACLGQHARARGLRVVLDLDGLDGPALWAQAQARGIPRAVRHGDDGTLRVEDADGLRSMAATDWEEVMQWLNR